MEYKLEDGDNCEENLHELKQAFKQQNIKQKTDGILAMIAGEPMIPGFE